MQTQKRPNRRPKLFLPLALCARPDETEQRTARAPFPLSLDQLRREVAGMVG
jgi:hypothetical protein